MICLPIYPSIYLSISLSVPRGCRISQVWTIMDGKRLDVFLDGNDKICWTACAAVLCEASKTPIPCSKGLLEAAPPTCNHMSCKSCVKHTRSVRTSGWLQE